MKKKRQQGTSIEQVGAFYQAMVSAVPARVKNQPFAAADMIDYFLVMEEIKTAGKK